MKIVALDQSTVITGVAVFDNGELIAYNALDLHTNRNLDSRMEIMLTLIDKTIKHFKPDVVVYEDVCLQRMPSTLITLAQLQGAIMYCCLMNKTQYEIIKPTQWRKLLSFKQGKNCKREQLKQQAKEYVKNTYDLQLSEDVCDAICIGKAYCIRNSVDAKAD